MGACWLDVDRDGDLDLFLANQSGAADAVWRNDGTGFVDVAVVLGMTGPRRSPEQGGVGCAIGDYDNDGDLDIFSPNYGRNLLYRNNDDGSFTEVGEALAVGVDNHAVGADWGDYDNDGDLDLSVIAYEGAAGAQRPANMLFRNDGAAGFVNVLGPDSPMNVADHGAQFVDYDGDGDLDLSVTDGYGPEGGHFLFRNELSGPCSCSTRPDTRRGSVQRSEFSTPRGGSSAHARSSRGVATIRSAQGPCTSVWPPDPRSSSR